MKPIREEFAPQEQYRFEHFGHKWLSPALERAIAPSVLSDGVKEASAKCESGDEDVWNSVLSTITNA